MKDYGDSYMTAFGPGSSYDVPNTNTKPIQGPWRSSGMKRSVSLLSIGLDNSNVKLVPCFFPSCY